MSKASLELGGGNWGTKDGNLLAYAQGNESSKFVPREFTFTRGSDIAATRINSSGLIEKYRENLLLQSNQFDTTWSSANASVTSGQLGYDGSNNAWLLGLDYTGGQGSYLRQEKSISGVNTFSMYAKKGSNDGVYVEFATGNYPNIKVDLSDGSLISTNGTINTKIESVGNGWYRVSMSINQSLARVNIRSVNGSGINTTGNIYIQDAQLERGLVATSYLESGATTATSGVADNEPRINYAGGTASLLLEPSRTNSWIHSEYLNYSFSQILSTTITQNTTETLSPEGLYNATKLEGIGSWIFKDFLAGTDTGTWTVSCWVKAVNPSSNNTFRLSVSGNNFSSNLTATNDWQRFSFSVTNGGATAAGLQRDTSANDADLYIYGLQVEAGSYPTSYIPTYGTSVTRNADYFDSSADFTNFFGNNQGTIYIETNRRLFKGGVNNDSFIGFRENSSGNYWRIIGRDSQVFVQSIGWGNTQIIHYYYASNPTKYLFKWDGTTISFFVGGSLVGSTTQTATFNPDAFGRTGGGVSMASQEFLNKFTLFPTALSDAECITLTT